MLELAIVVKYLRVTLRFSLYAGRNPRGWETANSNVQHMKQKAQIFGNDENSKLIARLSKKSVDVKLNPPFLF